MSSPPREREMVWPFKDSWRGSVSESMPKALSILEVKSSKLT